jgi:GNAT superfamily N-acetyltransferase
MPVRSKSRKSISSTTKAASDGHVVEQLVFHEVDQDRWRDMEQLFESRGGPHNCWCMVWRATTEEAKHTDGASRKAALLERVASHVPIGILGYLDGKPVAWCSIAPRATYRPLRGKAQPDDDQADVWSLVCFFVARALRGQGVLTQLIQASVEHACKRGAKIVEAYPVDPDSPSYRFMGFKPSFEAAGFHEVGRAGSRRYVMRFELT